MEGRDFYLLGFLLIFHILGAIALANATRGLWKAAQGEPEPVFGHLFFLFFGGLFGCSPLYYGLRYAFNWWFLTTQLAAVLTTFLVTLFVGREILYGVRSVLNINTGVVVVGGLFVIAGLVSAVLVFTERNGLILSLLFGGTFSIIGAGIIILGVIRR